MEEEANPKRQRISECQRDSVENVIVKKPRTPATDEALDNAQDPEQQDVMAAWVTLDDETVTELSELLDSSEATSSLSAQPFNFKVKFIENPYMSSMVFQSSSAYVTINGNEESCGSSFSDSDSSVMASVDMRSVKGAVRKLSGELNVDGGSWSSDAADDARGWVEESDYVGGIFVKALSGYDLFGTPPPCGYKCDNDSGGGDDDEMWVNFLGEDLFGGSGSW